MDHDMTWVRNGLKEAAARFGHKIEPIDLYGKIHACPACKYEGRFYEGRLLGPLFYKKCPAIDSPCYLRFS